MQIQCTNGAYQTNMSSCQIAKSRASRMSSKSCQLCCDSAGHNRHCPRHTHLRLWYHSNAQTYVIESYNILPSKCKMLILALHNIVVMSMHVTVYREIFLFLLKGKIINMQIPHSEQLHIKIFTEDLWPQKFNTANIFARKLLNANEKVASACKLCLWGRKEILALVLL